MEAQRDEVLLREIALLLGEVTGEDEEWSDRITETTTLDDDLRLESIEVVALDAAMRERYGGGADLTGVLAGLDIDEAIEFSVGDLMTLAASQPAGRR